MKTILTLAILLLALILNMGCSNTWSGVKSDSSEAWDKTKEGSKKVWDSTKESIHNATE